MPIWRLEPCDLSDPNWEGSSHRGPVVVRAPSESAARKAAEKAFGVKTRFAPGEGVHVPPWLRSELVRAKIVGDSIYPADGPVEVLEPSFETDLPQRERRRATAQGRRGKITPRETS